MEPLLHMGTFGEDAGYWEAHGESRTAGSPGTPGFYQEL